MITTATINHAGAATEDIPVVPTATPQHVELRRHSFLLPLGPGDVVEVDEQGVVTRVVSLAPQWIYMVDLHLPADYLAGAIDGNHPAARAVNELVAEWSRDTAVTMMHGFAMVVSSTSERWFEEKVRSSKYVEHCEELRNPRTETVVLTPA